MSTGRYSNFRCQQQSISGQVKGLNSHPVLSSLDRTIGESPHQYECSVFSPNQTRSPKDLACREVGTHSPLSRSQMLRLLLPIAAMNLSSAEKWRSRVKCPGRFNKRIRRFESTSHIKMWKSSSLKATLLLSDENATDQTVLLCSSNWSSCSPVCASQMRTEQSREPETIRRSSRENATQKTAPVWPFSGPRTVYPVSPFHTLSVQSLEPEARSFPLWENARPNTRLVCPRNAFCRY